MSDGILINSSGTIAAVVHGFTGPAPAGLTFTQMADVSKVQAGMASYVATQDAAQAALDLSDTTMHRIAEAVTLGLNSWTGADVVAWVTYRRELRAIAGGAPATALPTKPAYPTGS